MAKLPTLKEVVAAIGLRTGRWVGNCYGISCMIVEAKLVEGDAVYGHWLGYVAPNSFFARSAVTGFVQHGWILLKDGRIMDPTRWVFEAVPPYLYVGGKTDEYDEGGNKLRVALRPPPKSDSPRDKRLKLSRKTNAFVRDLLTIDQFTDLFTVTEIFWLANASYDILGAHVQEIYTAIDRAGYDAAVPLDNRRRAEREAGEKRT